MNDCSIVYMRSFRIYIINSTSPLDPSPLRIPQNNNDAIACTALAFLFDPSARSSAAPEIDFCPQSRHDAEDRREVPLAAQNHRLRSLSLCLYMRVYIYLDTPRLSFFRPLLRWQKDQTTRSISNQLRPDQTRRQVKIKIRPVATKVDHLPLISPLKGSAREFEDDGFTIQDRSLYTLQPCLKLLISNRTALSIATLCSLYNNFLQGSFEHGSFGRL